MTLTRKESLSEEGKTGYNERGEGEDSKIEKKQAIKSERREKEKLKTEKEKSNKRKIENKPGGWRVEVYLFYLQNRISFRNTF